MKNFNSTIRILIIIFCILMAYSTYAQRKHQSKQHFLDTTYQEATIYLDTSNTVGVDTLTMFRDGTTGRLFWGIGLGSGGGDLNLIDSIKLVNDSILRQWNDGSIIRTDTIRIAGTGGGGGTNYTDSTRLRRDSVLYYYLNGALQDSATIRPSIIGNAGDNIEIVNNKFALDSSVNIRQAIRANVVYDTLAGLNDSLVIDFTAGQGYYVFCDSAVNSLIKIRRPTQLQEGYIQDVSVTFVTDTMIAPPALIFNGGQFQFIEGTQPSLTTTKTDAFIRDVFTFRYDGLPEKRVKVVPVKDFRNN